MKPAGIERDKQIAEMRGEVCAFYVKKVVCASACESPNECDHPLIKPYSTDISAAMELWEEMKAAVLFVVLCNPEKGDILCSVQDTHGEEYYAEAETESDAISGAWIRWKEGE